MQSSEEAASSPNLPHLSFYTSWVMNLINTGLAFVWTLYVYIKRPSGTSSGGQGVEPRLSESLVTFLSHVSRLPLSAARSPR